MTTIAILCGYRELPSLREYVARLAPQLREEEAAFAILSGGITSQWSQMSEAAVMGEALAELAPEQPFLLEEESMTTLDNLVLCRRLAERTFGRIARWSVFCDSAHRVKVGILTRLVLGRHAVVHHVPRAVPLGTRLLEPPTIAVEACAALVPALRPAVRAFAKWWRGGSDVPRDPARPHRTPRLTPERTDRE